MKIQITLSERTRRTLIQILYVIKIVCISFGFLGTAIFASAIDSESKIPTYGVIVSLLLIFIAMGNEVFTVVFLAKPHDRMKTIFDFNFYCDYLEADDDDEYYE